VPLRLGFIKSLRSHSQPDVLKIKGNWRDAVKKSLAKKKPPGGWPK
jgi:hypothetical protein